MSPIRRLLLRLSFLKLGSFYRQASSPLDQDVLMEPLPVTSTEGQTLQVSPYLPMKGLPPATGISLPTGQPSSSMGAQGQTQQSAGAVQTGAAFGMGPMSAPHVEDGSKPPADTPGPGITSPALYTKAAFWRKLFNRR